jgi:hypothetical protein
MLSLTPQTGGTLDPAHVVGRDDLILEIANAARRGVHHLLTDPRRMGKTALLTRLCNEPGKATSAVKIDLEGSADDQEIVVRILRGLTVHQSLSRRALEACKGLLAEVESASVGPVELSKSAKAIGALPTLRSALARINDKLADDDETLIICLDEVTIAIENIAKRDRDEASRVLQTLRALREDHRQIAWILTGSIGFHHVLRKANATEGAVNNLDTVDLGPLSEPAAIELTEALARGIGRPITHDAVVLLVDATNGIAFMIHNVMHRLAAGTGEITGVEADAACNDYLSDPGKSGAFTHLVTRIDPYYSDPSLAKKVLDARAVAVDAASFDDLHRELGDGSTRDEFIALMDDLVADHYLDHETHLWRYDVIRRIWCHRRKLTV